MNFTFKDGTGENITSINLQESETKKKIYMGLINCYIALKDFESAKAAITLALKQWPHEDEFFKIDQTINIFLDFQVSREQIENRVAELELELNNQKIKYQNKINEVRQWALKLIEIQNSTMNSKQLTIESEEDWQTIFQQIHDIALYIKNNNEDKVTYNKIKDKFCQEFKGISKEGLEFLSTGEYLYQLHKDQEIDFAPVMVEFAKVIEIELNLHLKKHKLIHKNTNLTLGQLNHQLKTFKVSTLPNITSFLDQLIRYRNGSAHTGQSTITKVEKVREMILNDGWLKLIIS
ncbi:hypothetical protein [Geobacillus zalihae]|uniref:hypothetical protein n=1 Tax=Geobacillus zalihae TaxID=213419 RepID=UPI0016818B16|nr:hypothetical protein [Geobacillus zalihae]QNU25067.1 hypothetical protein IC806_01740 [Geobacillus zalihae]